MKKKLGVIVTLLGIIFLTACIEISNVDTIVFETMPKTTYLVGEELEEFEVRITFLDETEDLIISSYSDQIEITGFNTDSAGTRTLYVKYEDVSVSIVYTVTSLFADGTGTVADPYEISTAYHFMNIFTQSSDGMYYELTGDIDFSNVTELQYNSHLNNTDVNPFKGEITGSNGSGGNYAIKNYDYKYVFGFDLGTSVITNIDFVNITSMRSIIAYGVLDGAQVEITNVNVDANSSAVVGGLLAYLYIPTVDTTVTFDNVVFRGTVVDAGWGVGAFVGHAGSGGHIDVNIIDCANYGTIIGSNALTGAFIGQNPAGVTISFEDTINYGDVYFIGTSAPTSVNPFANGASDKEYTGTNLNNGDMYFLSTKSGSTTWGLPTGMTNGTGSELVFNLQALSNLSLQGGFLKFDGILAAHHYVVTVQMNVDLYMGVSPDFVMHSGGYPRIMNTKSVNQPVGFSSENDEVVSTLIRMTSVLQKTDLVTVTRNGVSNVVVSLKSAPDAAIGLNANETGYVFDTLSTSENVVYLLSSIPNSTVTLTYRVTAYNATGVPISSTTYSETITVA